MKFALMIATVVTVCVMDLVFVELKEGWTLNSAKAAMIVLRKDTEDCIASQYFCGRNRCFR